jgi:hypothetical protein
MTEFQNMDARGKESVVESEDSVGHLDRTPTVEIDNYHGLTAKTMVVFAVSVLPGSSPVQPLI